MSKDSKIKDKKFEQVVKRLLNTPPQPKAGAKKAKGGDCRPKSK